MAIAMLLLTWIVLAVLAIALAALVREVKSIRDALGSATSRDLVRNINASPAGQLLASYASQGTAFFLLVDPSCANCAEVLAAYESISVIHPRIRFGVIAPSRMVLPPVCDLEVTRDEELLRTLSLPFRPALVVTSSLGVTEVHPVGSATSLHTAIERTVVALRS